MMWGLTEEMGAMHNSLRKIRSLIKETSDILLKKKPDLTKELLEELLSGLIKQCDQAALDGLKATGKEPSEETKSGSIKQLPKLNRHRINLNNFLIG